MDEIDGLHERQGQVGRLPRVFVENDGASGTLFQMLVTGLKLVRSLF